MSVKATDSTVLEKIRNFFGINPSNNPKCQNIPIKNLNHLKKIVPPIKVNLSNIKYKKPLVNTSSEDIKNLDPKRVNLNPLDPTEKKSGSLNPRLMAILLIQNKIYLIDKNILKKLDEVNKNTDLKEKILNLMSKIDKKFPKNLSEEDKEILKILNENGIEFKTKEEAKNHYDTLTLKNEMDQMKVSEKFIRRKNMTQIAFSIIQKDLTYSRSR